MSDGVPVWIRLISLDVLDAGVQEGKCLGNAVQDMPDASFLEVSTPRLELRDPLVQCSSIAVLEDDAAETVGFDLVFD